MTPFTFRSLLIAVALACGPELRATNYYVNDSNGGPGSDSNSGTSSSSPWLTFNNVNGHTFQPGDTINLACGCTWNQEMDLMGTGTSSSWITVTSYGNGKNPVILRNSLYSDRCVRLTNPDYWSISNLEVGEAGAGILVEFTTISHNGVSISNIYAHDCDGITEYADGGNDLTAGMPDCLELSAGIAIAGNVTLSSEQYCLKGLTIENVEGTRNMDGIEIEVNWNVSNGTIENGQAVNVPPGQSYSAGTTDGGDGHTVVQNVFLTNLYLHDDGSVAGSPSPDGFRILRAENITMTNSTLNNEVGGSVGTGTASGILFFVQNMNVTNCIITNTPDTGSNDETGWDNEGMTNFLNFNGNYFGNNAGAGIEFLADCNPTLNNSLSGNLFVNNGLGNTSGGTTSIGGFCVGSAPTSTGEAENNLYWEPGSGLAEGFNGGGLVGYSFNDNYQADAAADTFNAGNGFGNTQGANQWSYQFYTGGSWSNMTTYNSSPASWTGTQGLWSSWGANGNTARVWAEAEQPDANNSDWVARAWTAPHAGLISIRGWAAMQATGGNGVLLEITQNGTAIWGGASGTAIAGNNQAGFSTNADLSVNAGDVIRFQVNDNGASSNSADIVSWAPNIIYNGALGITSTTGAFSADVGIPFSYQITTDEPTSNFSATGLPAGLSIDAATGLISGSPTAASVGANGQQTYNITISATNASTSTSATLTLTIMTPGFPTITSPTFAGALVGQPLSYQITTAGPASSYGATSLPTGFTINKTTGVITGTLKVATERNVQIKATNASGTATMTLALIFQNPPPSAPPPPKLSNTIDVSIFVPTPGNPLPEH